MNRRNFHQILKRYVLGRATDDEKALVDQWYQLLDDENLLQMEETEIKLIENRLWDKIQLQKNRPEHRSIRKMWVKLAVAASLLGVIVTTVYLMNTRITKAPWYAHDIREKKMKELFNTTDLPLKLNMEDGSVVTLQPGSSVSYPSSFAPDKREVYLEGEAFFEVSKNPNRPFYVYNHDLITHVLGTSFNVKADKLKKIVEVSVVTGKVQVYESRRLSNTGNSEGNNGVILMPNEKVIYKENERHFTATLVNNPVPVSSAATISGNQPESFVFEETRLSAVLKSLENTYGIDIVAEDDNIYKCLFTGDITKYDFYTKLNIICQSLNDSYEIAGTQILIKGKGCN